MENTNTNAVESTNAAATEVQVTERKLYLRGPKGKKRVLITMGADVFESAFTTPGYDNLGGDRAQVIVPDPEDPDMLVTLPNGEEVPFNRKGWNPACGPRCPKELSEYTGDEVAETFDGITADTSTALWERVSDDENPPLKSIWKYLSLDARKNIVAALKQQEEVAPPTDDTPAAEEEPASEVTDSCEE